MLHGWCPVSKSSWLYEPHKLWVSIHWNQKKYSIVCWHCLPMIMQHQVPILHYDSNGLRRRSAPWEPWEIQQWLIAASRYHGHIWKPDITSNSLYVEEKECGPSNDCLTMHQGMHDAKQCTVVTRLDYSSLLLKKHSGYSSNPQATFLQVMTCGAQKPRRFGNTRVSSDRLQVMPCGAQKPQVTYLQVMPHFSWMKISIHVLAVTVDCVGSMKIIEENWVEISSNHQTTGWSGVYSSGP